MTERKIFKYVLPFAPNEFGPTSIEMPRGATVVHVDRDPASSRIALWAVVTPSNDTTMRDFKAVGTGHAFISGKYVGTAIIDPFVWHVFEVTA